MNEHANPSPKELISIASRRCLEHIHCIRKPFRRIIFRIVKSPSGMFVAIHGIGTHRVYRPNLEAFLPHRLDIDTSGLMIVGED